MKRKLVAGLLTLTMAVGLLAGCGGSGSGSSGDSGSGDSADGSGKPYEGVTLTLWGGAQELGDDNTGTQALLKKATEELGMEFEIEINPGGSEGDNILKTRCASGDLPDLVNWNCGSKSLSLNPKEYFLDLSDQEFADKLDDTYKTCVTQDGMLLGAPYTTTQAGAVVYWKPDYEELGLEVPKTWDEFLANCDALEKAGKTPLYLSGGDTWTTQVLFLGDNYNVIAEDPSFADDFTAGTANFENTPAALHSWEKYEDLVGKYNADASAAKYEDGQEAIATGQATHWIILTQAVSTMVANHPDAADKIGVFGVPGDDADNAGLTVWEPNSWYISKDSANAEAATAFLNFWLDEENVTTFIENFGADGPSCIKGYELPDSVCPAVREDMQAYFDAGKTTPALEFLSMVKGTNCEQLTTAMALGQEKAANAAKAYDEDCAKSAVQLGLDWK